MPERTLIHRMALAAILVAASRPATTARADQPPGAPPGAARPAAEGGRGRVEILSNEEAWRLLPKADEGSGLPLPAWARALARSLPRTTAAMLDLDRLHRTRSPLGLRLRGQMRWVAAEANGCDYSRAYAEADLRAAGLDEAGWRGLRGDRDALTEDERRALNFARKMTLDASEVTDAEVAELMERFGESKVTAMVLLLAYSNFQDRLLLSLGLSVEPDGPMPPPEIRFARDATPPPVPARVPPEGRTPPPAPEQVDDAAWRELDFDDLQKNLDRQRANPGRIRVPTWEEVLKVVPPTYTIPPKPVRIQWSLVCMGYQPELALGWNACTGAFRQEAKQDRVFEESLFWVVTRTIHCFY